MIRAVMPEFQFKSFSPKRETAKLMPETNPENRDAPRKLANIIHGVADRLRIAGAVGKEDAVRIERKHVIRGSLRGYHPRLAVVVRQKAQNILLDAVIVRDDAKAAPVRAAARFRHSLRPRRYRQINRALVPAVGFFRRNVARKFLP